MAPTGRGVLFPGWKQLPFKAWIMRSNVGADQVSESTPHRPGAMTRPAVSVIIVNYNGGAWLVRALETLLAPRRSPRRRSR